MEDFDDLDSALFGSSLKPKAAKAATVESKKKVGFQGSRNV